MGIKTRIDSTTNLKEVMGGERAGEYPQRVIRPQRVNAALLQTVEHTGADAVATDEITADVFVEGLFSHLSGGKIDKEQLPHVSAGHYFSFAHHELISFLVAVELKKRCDMVSRSYIIVFFRSPH